MKPLHLGLGCALAAMAAWWLFATEPAAEKAHKLTTISPRKFADSLHAVIAADRAEYARLVERWAVEGRRLEGSQDRAQDGLPAHAQLLRAAATRIQQRGAEFSYTLRSLWPINPGQGPQTEVEQAGLEALTRNPDANVYTEEMLGGRSYFTAIYPDKASLASCADCHNRHPDSPRRDFKPGDVMGALVIRVPLEF